MYKQYARPIGSGIKLLLLAVVSFALIGVSGCASFKAPPGEHVDMVAAVDIAFTLDEVIVQRELIEGMPKDRTKWTPAETQLYESMVLNVLKLTSYGIEMANEMSPPYEGQVNHTEIVTEAADPKVAL